MKNVGYILIVCLILKLGEGNFDMTPQMLKDGTTSNITLSGDAQFGFFFTDLKQSGDSSGNTNFDDLTKSYNVTQFIATQVGVPTTYNFIPNPSYDIQSSILNQMQQYSTMIPTTDSIYTEGRMYMTKKILLSSIPHTGLYALRLTNPNTNSFGYATISNKQKILYGFETNFSLNIAHANLKGNKYAGVNDIAEGFALIFQDVNVDLSTLTLDKDNGLGFSGLTNSVAVKFDFHIDLNSTFPYLTHPGQPYVSVHVSNPLTSDYSSVIGFAWLPYSLTKGGQHHVTINYTRAIEDEPYLGDLSFTTYGGSLLDYTDPSSWFSKFKLGLLKIYIDDMDRSVLQVPINLGSSVQTDDLTGINPNTGIADGTMAAKSWVSLSATTSNTTSQSAAFQILEWNFSEAQKGRIALVNCYKGIDITNSKILSTLKLKNIGKEILYIKVIYDSTDSVEYNLDQETWHEGRDSNGDIIPTFIDYSFYNGFLDGGSFQLNIDDTIQDVVIHNHLNESYSSLNTYFEIIDNPEILNSTQEIGMRTNNEVVEIGFCGGGKGIDIFDDLVLYNLGKQTYCQNKYLSNSRGFGFEASHTNATNENLVFQNHTICNECAFDSQGSWFLPNAVGIPSSNIFNKVFF